jgi:trimethylamine--corrinoid protein Co-methyltransferase
MTILEKIGIFIEDAQGLTFFENAGCNVDYCTKKVRIPESLVKECVKKAPSSLRLAARNNKSDVLIERGKTATRPNSGNTNIFNLETFTSRKATQQDAKNAIILIDALDNISFSSTHIMPNDVHIGANDLYAALFNFKNTDKHFIFSPLSSSSLEYIVRMAFIVQGSEEEFKKRPLVSSIASTNSPLKLGKNDMLVLIKAAKYGIPILLASSPLVGATGPVTHAGSLALAAAENLAMNIVVQLIKPRSPVIYGLRCIPFDMRTSISSYGSVEFTLLSAAGVQLAHYYELPADAHGTTTNSKVLDEQAGFEKAISAILPSMAGAEIISGSGVLEEDNTSSLEQLVIDNEFFGIMFKALRGIKVDEETLAINTIKNATSDGQFLTKRHTFKHYRKESFQPKLLDYNTRYRWMKKGGKDITLVAQEKTKRILEEHKPVMLDRDIIKNLESVVKEFEKSTYLK